MIPAHTPVGTVVVQVNYDNEDRASLVVTKTIREVEEWLGPEWFTRTQHTQTTKVSTARLYALADLVAQASWNGADVFKALGVNLGDDAKRLQNQAAMWRQACEQDRPFESIMRAAGREDDLLELEALREKAAKWDALSSGKPVEISPGITLESVPSPRPDPMERIAAACESIDKRLKSVISEAGGLVRVSS